MPNCAEDHEPTPEELLEDQGLDRCEQCSEWYQPDGQDLHPGCPARATDLRITFSTQRS